MYSIKSDITDVIHKIDFENCIKHPNILIAARIWEDERYNAACVCYKFMRKIDDLIDDKKAINPEFTDEEKKELTEEVNYWINCLQNNAERDPLMQEINEVINKFKIPLYLFENFAKSMIYDINNTGFETFDDFLAYAEGASVAPASIFVHLCCLNYKNGEYLPYDFDLLEVSRPCAIFSYLVHIVRDFQKDQLDNLNYFSLDILKKHDLKPSDLMEMARGSKIKIAFREVIRDYCNYADLYKTKTFNVIDKLTPTLRARYFISLYVIFSLYQQVYERIDIENGTFSTEELNPKPYEIKERVLKIVEELEF